MIVDIDIIEGKISIEDLISKLIQNKDREEEALSSIEKNINFFDENIKKIDELLHQLKSLITEEEYRDYVINQVKFEI
jgi:hypothetical protein